MAVLTKAIPQERYVKITSKNIGDSEISERMLSGLVFTKGAGMLSSVEKDYTKIYEYGSLSSVLSDFSSTSAEYAFAERYFGYVSPSASAPRKLAFVLVKSTTSDGGDTTWETAAEAFNRVTEMTSNFGSFCFLDGWTYDTSTETWTAVTDFDNAALAKVAAANKGLNYKFLMSVATVADNVSGEYTTTKAEAAADTIGGTGGATNGVCLMQAADPFGAADAMAIFAAVDYDSGTNTATDFMFKQIDGETDTVDSDADANTLDGKNVNYYGRVQINGQQVNFYQLGVNLDGEATAVYCNEVWMKSRISTAILDLALSVEKIPYNKDGQSLIYNTICSVAEIGCRNGSILLGKELTSAQKRKIYQVTGNSEAWFSVQDAGYWIEVTLQENPSKAGQYMAVYKLVYSKGDAIHYFEGKDFLV